MAGIANLGGIVGAFAKPKTKRVYNSNPLQKQIDTSIGGLNDYRGDMSGIFDQYQGAMGENVADQRRYAKMAEGELGTVMGDVLGGDFMTDRERIRSGDLASLNELLGQMGGGMSAADKTASARLGYAGRPSGTYQDKARQSYLGAFASPLAGQIYGGLNTGATAAGNARTGKAGTVTGLIEARSRQPDKITDRILEPMKVRSGMMQDEIGALSGLGGVVKDNLAGFKEEKNQWASALDAADSSINSAVDTGLSLYGLGGFGGFGGGGAGGAAGGGGGGFFGKMFQQREGSIPMTTYNNFQPTPQWNSGYTPWQPSMAFGMPNQGFGINASYGPQPAPYYPPPPLPAQYDPLPAPRGRPWG